VLCEALLFAFAANRTAIVDGAVEDDVSSSRKDWSGEGLAGIGRATILMVGLRR
jgi:hypothetical protein